MKQRNALNFNNCDADNWPIFIRQTHIYLYVLDEVAEKSRAQASPEEGLVKYKFWSSIKQIKFMIAAT